tara:strand:- start:43231 stop:43335 length:105 start_codon:yes stop_codon:yes gene_type:complete
MQVKLLQDLLDEEQVNLIGKLYGKEFEQQKRSSF